MPEGDKPNPLDLKEQGNQAYRDGDYDKAISRYTEVNHVKCLLDILKMLVICS